MIKKVSVLHQGGFFMSFQLKQDKKESENKTIRFPLPLVNRIEEAIVNKNVSFSSFVIQACEYALNNMPQSHHELNP